MGRVNGSSFADLTLIHFDIFLTMIQFVFFIHTIFSTPEQEGIMINNEKVIQTIFDAIDEINEQRPDEPPLAKSTGTVLFGESGTLDSLGLVHFIVAVEQGLEETFGVSLILADEKAMSQKNSPFRSVETLAEYASALMEKGVSE